MPSSDVLLGLLFAAAAAACFDGAVILQATEAQAVDNQHGLRPSLITRLIRRPKWLLGTVIATLGWPLQLAAFALAPITLVQPTLALGLVLLLVLGSRILGEHVPRASWIAAGCVLVGVAVLTVVAPERAEALPDRTRLIVISAVLIAVIAAPFVRGQARSGAWLLIASAGSAFALTALTGKLVVTELEHGRPLAALAWGAATGAAAAIGFLVDMTALQRFPATRVAPPMFVLETAIPVAVAPILLHESWGDTPGGGVFVVLALLLVLAGGVGLGRSHAVLAIEHPDGPPGPGGADPGPAGAPDDAQATATGAGVPDRIASDPAASSTISSAAERRAP